jgi:hypothetical protein
MLIKANIWYPSDIYTFSFEKYKEKKLQGISQSQNVLFMYTMYYRQQRTSTLQIWKELYTFLKVPDSFICI